MPDFSDNHPGAYVYPMRKLPDLLVVSATQPLVQLNA